MHHACLGRIEKIHWLQAELMGGKALLLTGSHIDTRIQTATMTGV
jgi:hypothetical protein